MLLRYWRHILRLDMPLRCCRDGATAAVVFATANIIEYIEAARHVTSEG